MRKTLDEYVIEFDSNAQTIRDSVMDFTELVCKYVELTSRAPRLGDFVPCDDEGNVLGNPFIDSKGLNSIHFANWKRAKDKVIFEGDWEVIENTEGVNSIVIISNGTHKFATSMGCFFDNNLKPINRIEDLPLEIEFKEGVI